MLHRGSLLTVRVQPVCKCLMHLLALLRFDVMPYRLFGYRTYGTGVIRPAPQRREPTSQRLKFIAQYAAGKPFELRDNLSNTARRVVFDKKMNVVWHDFKRMNCQPKFFCLLIHEFGEPVFDITNQYLAAILRTPDYV